MRSTYKVHNQQSVYFITSTIVNWINIFTSEKYFNILIEALNFYVEKQKLSVIAFVIMKNHFHMICKSENLTETIRLIKSYTAKKIISELERDNPKLLKIFTEYKKDYKIKSTYQIWQEGFHPQEVINNQILKQKIEYIHNNPVKAGYCNLSDEWKYSSSEFYFTGKKSMIKIERLI
ncbi:MAG: transposase [Ignavibacteria bacterium]|nr:transposase [Ignavibacteria bacterium]